MSKVNVAVRVRPFNRREIKKESTCVIAMDGEQTICTHPETGAKKVRSDSTEPPFGHPLPLALLLGRHGTGALACPILSRLLPVSVQCAARNRPHSAAAPC